jgi:hypothetical protein
MSNLQMIHITRFREGRTWSVTRAILAKCVMKTNSSIVKELPTSLNNQYVWFFI